MLTSALNSMPLKLNTSDVLSYALLPSGLQPTVYPYFLSYVAFSIFTTESTIGCGMYTSDVPESSSAGNFASVTVVLCVPFAMPNPFIVTSNWIGVL